MRARLALDKFSSKGFTLIELLIVIAILGVLAAGILVAIDPVDKINQANDSKVQNDISAMGRAAEAYATTHGGFYPAGTNSTQVGLTDLVTSGELKRVPKSPYGPEYWTTNPTSPGCVSGSTCTDIYISSRLYSKKFTSTINAPYWIYNSSNGKSCAIPNDLNPPVCP